MLDHMILTVSDIKRSLAFYEAALKPLNIRFFMPYKGTRREVDKTAISCETHERCKGEQHEEE